MSALVLLAEVLVVALLFLAFLVCSLSAICLPGWRPFLYFAPPAFVLQFALLFASARFWT